MRRPYRAVRATASGLLGTEVQPEEVELPYKYHITGRVRREDDPMYDPMRSKIEKYVWSLEEVGETMVKWTERGRLCTGVTRVLTAKRSLVQEILDNYPTLS